MTFARGLMKALTPESLSQIQAIPYEKSWHNRLFNSTYRANSQID